MHSGYNCKCVLFVNLVSLSKVPSEVSHHWRTFRASSFPRHLYQWQVVDQTTVRHMKVVHNLSKLKTYSFASIISASVFSAYNCYLKLYSYIYNYMLRGTTHAFPRKLGGSRPPSPPLNFCPWDQGERKFNSRFPCCWNSMSFLQPANVCHLQLFKETGT